MNISFYFSSPGGDVPIDSETFARPFIVEPLKHHAFMTLADFFHIVSNFILSSAGPVLTSALSRSWGQDVILRDIDNIVFRYEKYGTLYQIVSAEIFAGTQKAKFAISTAIMPNARDNLQMEYNLLSYINTKTGLPYLPHVMSINSQDIEKDGIVDTVVLTLGEWFEGYHEWHFSKDDKGKDTIVIWDTEKGNRLATDEEAHTIIREASRILTLYYDVESSERITPWHHGAGDFIVKTGSGNVDVRLVTARGYDAFVSSDACDSINPLWGLHNFFFELITKIRLDKHEGMGDTTWAGSGFVTAAIEGFVQAMRTKEVQGQCRPLMVADFITSAKALSQDEIEQIINAQFTESQTSDYEIIKANLKNHTQELVRALQQLS